MSHPPPNPPSAHRKRSIIIARIAAIACSLALVGGYLVYRSGKAVLMPGTKSGRIERPPDDPEWLLMSSSKSGPIVQPAAPATQPARRVLPGSKSMRVLDEDDTVLYGDGATTAPATQPNPFRQR